MVIVGRSKNCLALYGVMAEQTTGAQDGHNLLPILPLRDMANRHRGLTAALAESYLEAARVSLARHHSSPQEFVIQHGADRRAVLVEWVPPDDRCLRAWANVDDATRDGAYAFALAAIESALELYAIRRAEILTGADYYIAPLDHTGESLENCFRLEVSGTNLDERELYRRLQDKVEQAREGESNLPALVAVVGFRVKIVAIQLVEGPL